MVSNQRGNAFDKLDAWDCMDHVEFCVLAPAGALERVGAIYRFRDSNSMWCQFTKFCVLYPIFEAWKRGDKELQLNIISIFEQTPCT